MSVATSCVLHRAMTFQQSETYTRKFTTVLLASMIIETIYHSVMNEEFVHQASWLVLLVLVAWKTRALIRERLHLLPASAALVVRATPAAAATSSRELGADLDRCLSRVLS